jgi:hypothetical protein
MCILTLNAFVSFYLNSFRVVQKHNNIIIYIDKHEYYIIIRIVSTKRLKQRTKKIDEAEILG